MARATARWAEQLGTACYGARSMKLPREHLASLGAWLRARSARPVLLWGWLLAIVYAFPGRLTESSATLLEQVRSRHATDEVSAPMVLLWRALELVVAGPLLLALAQLGLALAGFYGLARQALPPRAAAWVAAVTLLIPPVATHLVVLEPSALATALLMAGAAARLHPRATRRAGGLALLAAAPAVWPAVLAGAIILAIGLQAQRPGARLRRLATAVLAAVGVLAGAALLDAAATSERTYAARLRLAAADLRGTTELAPPPSGEALLAAASAARRAHPGAYLQHRLRLTGELLVAPDERTPARVDVSARTAPLSVRVRLSTVQHVLDRVADLAAHTPLFWPATYVLLALGLLVRGRPAPALRVLLASGLASLLAATLLAPAPSFAYAAPLVAAAVLALGTALARRANPGEPQPDAAPEPRGPWLTAPRILLGGWLLVLLYGVPGYMSYDSVFQLLEARAWHFSDGHPPLMAALWGVLDLFVCGPLPMLLLQSGAFLLGLYWIARHLVPARAAALVAVFVTCSPPVISVLAVIWKDSQMSAFLALGTGLVLSPRRGLRLAGLGALALATGMRHNALSITLPLVLLLFVWRPEHRGLRRYAIAMAAWLALTLAAQAANKLLTHERRPLWHESIALFDVLGVLHFLAPTETELATTLEGAPVIASELLSQAVAIDDRLGFFDGLYQARSRTFGTNLTAPERAAVERLWWRLVPRNPAAFARYRYRLALEILELRAPPPPNIYRSYTDHQDPALKAALLSHDASASFVQRWLQHRVSFGFRLPSSRVWAAFFASVALLPFCFGHRLALAVVLSGLFGEALLFAISPAGDTRYSVWLAIAASLALALRALTAWRSHRQT